MDEYIIVRPFPSSVLTGRVFRSVPDVWEKVVGALVAAALWDEG